jgi:hypothetical protein
MDEITVRSRKDLRRFGIRDMQNLSLLHHKRKSFLPSSPNIDMHYSPAPGKELGWQN